MQLVVAGNELFASILAIINVEPAKTKTPRFAGSLYVLQNADVTDRLHHTAHAAHAFHIRHWWFIFLG